MEFSSPPNPQQYQALVWEIVRQVPPGKVATYGQIAGMIPPPGSLNLKDYEAFGARWVGGAMANCPPDVPWSLLKKWSSSKHSQQGENRVKIRQSIHQECRHARKTQSSSQPI